jgi:putative PIG3 family NAD(P)H quinone oxidoreductase
MHAITVVAPGGPESLRWAEAPDPVAGAGEVLVDVLAAGVNRADLLQREGRYDPPAGASPILGLECAGTITALGPGVSGWSVGDRVCALLAGGGYAERVAVPAGQLLPIPDGVDPVSAGGLPEVACTVWSNLVMIAGLRDGQTVLIHGGSSGIGTMAIQVARELGATVAVTAGTAEKLKACTDLGASVAIDYREQDFPAEIMAATENRGADVILDLIGAKYLQRNVSALADGGRLVIIGTQGGRVGDLDIGALMARRAGVIGTTLRSRPAVGRGSKAEVVAAVRGELWPRLATGAIRPVIGAVLPMTEAADAHRRLVAGEVIGKIVLTRSPEGSAMINSKQGGHP